MTPMPYPQISPDVAIAEAIWSLALHGHLSHKLDDLRRYALAVGIDVHLIQEQQATRPRTTMSPTRTIKPVSYVERNGQRRCARCKEWKPVETFPYKSSKAKGQRRSYCAPCWSARQKHVYLSRPKQDAMAEAGVRFGFVHDGQVALLCNACGKPVERGERAIVHGTIIHARCRS